MRQADLIVTAENLLTCAPRSLELGQGRNLLTCADSLETRPQASFNEGARLGAEMDYVGLVQDGALAVLDGHIVAVGTRAALLSEWEGPVQDYPHSSVVPGLVDCHTHPIFAGSRASEFVQRAQGATYEQIHAQGGGIAYTVRCTRRASDAELTRLTRRNLERMLRMGTTTVEAKSGYGLTPDEELRELRIINALAREMPMNVVPTFMGAHDIPEEYKGRADEYVDLLIEKMLPAVVEEKLAAWADVFCETCAFSLEQSRRLIMAFHRAGLFCHLHAEEFANSGTARMGASLGVRSVDHLLCFDPQDAPCLLASGTIPVLMPTTSFFLGQGRYAPGRALIDKGLPVALATDYNAGSNLTSSMPMAMSLAVLRLKFTPAEALIAATVNAACALNLEHKVGSLQPGRQADFLVLDCEDWLEWPYCYGVSLVKKVFRRGRAVVG